LKEEEKNLGREWGRITAVVNYKSPTRCTVAGRPARSGWDLNKIDKASVIDLTDPAIRNQHLRHPIPNALATASQEVVINGNIPADAIRTLIR
jgi:hypothetical protein